MQKSTLVLAIAADHAYRGNNYHVRELDSLRLSVERLDLDSHPAEDLPFFDMVELIGGNPLYLLDAIRSHRAEGILRQIAKKLLIG